MAALLAGGLLVVNPFGLHDPIFADNSPGTALGLLLFGFVVTSGSAAMGTVIMATGQRQADDAGPRSGQPRRRYAWTVGQNGMSSSRNMVFAGVRGSAAAGSATFVTTNKFTMSSRSMNITWLRLD